MRRYVEFILRFRVAVIGAVLLATAALVLQIKTLAIIFDPSTMLPQSHPHVAATNRVEEIFGSKYVVLVGVTPKHGDVFQLEVLAKVQRMTAGLLQAPNVVKANTLSLSTRKAKSIEGTAEGLSVRPLLPGGPVSAQRIAELKKALAANPVYRNAIVSADGGTAAILVEFKRHSRGFRDIVDSIMPVIDRERDATVDIAVGGVPIYVSHLERYSQRILYLFALAVLIIGLVHFDAFRTLQGLFLPLVTALLAVGWGVGLMAVMKVPMDAFNSTTPILILAVAAGHAVQLLKRYYEEYASIRATTALTPREANRRAVLESVSGVGPVMVTAGLVAAMGFFSLTVFDIATVRTYGIFTGMGILSAVVLEMTFTPALRSLLPPPKAAGALEASPARVWSRIIAALSALVLSRRRAWIYGVAGSLVAASLAALPLIEIDNSTKTYFSRDLQFQKDDAFLNARLGGTNTLHLLFQGREADAIKDPQVLRAMERAQAFLEEQPQVGKTVSLVDFVKRMNQAMHADEPAFYAIPDSQQLVSQYLLLYSLSGEPGDFDLYVDQDYRTANLVAYLKTDSSAYVAALIPALSRFIAKDLVTEKVSVQIGGSVPQAAALNEVMIESKILNILQITGVVLAVSALVFRSWIGGLLVLLPLAAAVLVNFGIMGLTGIRLNIPTSLTAAMAVGIGADYAIYLIFRMREYLRAGLPLPDAVRHAMHTAGTGCLYVALAVAAGYSVLLLSIGFYVHAWIAILIVAAMTVSVFSALTLIPSLVLTFQPRFLFREAAQKRAVPAATAMLVALALLGMLPPGAARAQAPAAKEIMERNYAATRAAGSFSKATFRLINSNKQERQRKTFGVTRVQKNGVDNMRVTRFLSPPDVRGTVTLLVEHAGADDDLWIYLPGLGKVRRLVSSNKKDSFMGTDFSYGDIMGHRVEDWNHRALGEEPVDGQPCFVIESVPANASARETSGYSKRVTWVRKDNFVSAKGQFWDENGQLLKTAAVRDIRLVDEKNGKWQGMILETVNLQTDHRTIIQFDEFQVSHSVRDDYFTTRYMERPE